jgi:predicted GTPase
VDPQRAGHEIKYHPGETNFLLADVIVINKMDSAKPEDVKTIIKNIKKYNPHASVIKAESSIIVDKPETIKGKRALVIEDGPTLTHGGMSFGAGTLVAKKYGAEIIHAEKYATGSIRNVYKKYKHLKRILPAMGYGIKQIRELETTINRAKCDIVIDASPANLTELIKINKPIVNVDYYLNEIGKPKIEDIIKKFLKKIR